MEQRINKDAEIQYLRDEDRKNTTIWQKLGEFLKDTRSRARELK